VELPELPEARTEIRNEMQPPQHKPDARILAEREESVKGKTMQGDKEARRQSGLFPRFLASR